MEVASNIMDRLLFPSAERSWKLVVNVRFAGIGFWVDSSNAGTIISDDIYFSLSYATNIFADFRLFRRWFPAKDDFATGSLDRARWKKETLHYASHNSSTPSRRYSFSDSFAFSCFPSLLRGKYRYIPEYSRISAHDTYVLFSLYDDAHSE